MERQEEKKIKFCKRKRKTQSTSISFFPLELTTEILLRLPARSVARFRCVSKLWLSITIDSYFINSFETRISTLHPSLLVCFKEGENLVVSSIPQQQTLQNPQPIYYRHHMISPGDNLPPTESVHGLICFQESATPIVWNPSKRQLLTLTKPRKSWENLTVLLGYDPVEGKHKVMCIPLSRSSDVCRVLTLGSAKESWRTVKTNHKHRSDYYTSGRCIKGIIYYIAYIYHTKVWVLMSFDVRYEKFGMLALPLDIRRDVMDVLIKYEGKLACVNKYKYKNKKKRLWILEDAEKQKWSSKDFLVPFGHYDESLRMYFQFKGFTHAGELIYVPTTFNKSYYILFCDPVRRSFRRFEFKGIADDESRPSNVLHAFPNHI